MTKSSPAHVWYMTIDCTDPQKLAGFWSKLLGLEIKGTARAEALQRAQQWLTAVGLGAFANRYPHMLSGGQRKRVALAQASATAEADRAKLDQLRQEHDQIMLQASQADAAVARAELARQRRRRTDESGGGGREALTSPMQGTVLAVHVAEGAQRTGVRDVRLHSGHQ